TGIISLLGEAFACKYMGDIFPGAGAHRFGLAQKISTVPASLLMILPVPFGHVFFKGGIPVLAVTSFMQCDALMLQVDLHGFGIIDRLQGLADILMRHAVVMPILAQGNMIVLLHFGPYAMPDLVRLSWQGMQQRLLLLLETLQPSPFLSGEGLLVMFDTFALDGGIQCLDGMEFLITQRSVNALIGELHLVLHVRFVFGL